MEYNEYTEPITGFDEIAAKADRYQFIRPERPAMVFGTLSSDQVTDWGITTIGAPYAWRYTKGRGVTVAVLDTGVSMHQDLDDNIVGRLTAEPGWSPFDSVGHGTHCAGIIAAIDNGTGVVGVAPEAKVLSVKVLGDDGSGSYESIAEGLRIAIRAKADIISMSLGCQYAPPDGTVQDLIDQAVNNGAIVLCAAGNDYAPGVNSIDFPARCSGTIPVAAIAPNGAHAPFSSEGGELRRGVSMPGVNIYSTYLNGGYARLSGTSMATPMLAGFIALMLSYHQQGEHNTPIGPQGTAGRTSQVWDHLTRYVRPLGDNEAFGIGVVDGSRLGTDGD